jgi:hypothetical protein
MLSFTTAPVADASPTWRLLASDVSAGMIAIARQGMDIVSVERHGTRVKDFRVFIVARKPD